MPSSSSILSIPLISGENTVYPENMRGLPSSTTTNTLLYSTDGDNYWITADSQNRNYLLTIDDQAQAKSTANIPIFNVKVDNAIESGSNSGIAPLIRRSNKKAVDWRHGKRNTDDNRKVSRMKSIPKETNSDFDDELPEQHMQNPLQKIKAKRRGNGAEHGVHMIHLHSKLTNQSSINNARSIVTENTIHLHHYDETNQTSKMRKDRSLVKHVDLSRQQIATNEHNLSQIETIELSSFNSTSKPLNAVAGASNLSPSNVHIEHIHIEKKKAQSKETAHPVVEKKQKRKKHSKQYKTPVQAMVSVKHVLQKNTANQ
jgi:hypothetical protein